MPMFDSVLPRPPDLKNEYERHKHVWTLVPDGKVREFQFLWGEKSLVVRAPCALDMATQVSEAVEPKDGATYEFSVLANPVRRFQGSGDRPIKDIALLRVWLTERMEGFSVNETYITKFPRRPIGKNENGFAYPVLFHGMATVKDEVNAQKTWSAGIGRTRAFGYGLLLLAPLN